MTTDYTKQAYFCKYFLKPLILLSSTLIICTDIFEQKLYLIRYVLYIKERVCRDLYCDFTTFTYILLHVVSLRIVHNEAKDVTDCIT